MLASLIIQNPRKSTRNYFACIANTKQCERPQLRVKTLIVTTGVYDAFATRKRPTKAVHLSTSTAHQRLVLLVIGSLLLLQLVELLATGLQHMLVHGGRAGDVRQDDQTRQDHQAKLVDRNLLQRLQGHRDGGTNRSVALMTESTVMGREHVPWPPREAPRGSSTCSPTRQ